MNLPAVLCAELAARRISLNRLAKDSGVPFSVVRRVVQGDTPNPGIKTVLALLVPLGHDLAWLHRKGVRA